MNTKFFCNLTSNDLCSFKIYLVKKIGEASTIEILYNIYIAEEWTHFVYKIYILSMLLLKENKKLNPCLKSSISFYPKFITN